MNIPKVIAICGHKRCGKDTLATYICKKYGYENIKIASKLKDTMKLLFGFTDDQLETEKETVDPRWGITPRKAMQFFGTEVMQFQLQKIIPNIDRSFWIKSTIEEMEKHPQKSYIISDMRFMHEHQELMKRFPVTVIRINRYSKTYDTHISETEYNNIPYDILLNNTSTIDHLIGSFEAEFAKWANQSN
jgi:hypothetical protein